MARWPSPVLRMQAAPVIDFDAALSTFCQMLVDGMESRAAAATQYGVDAQVVVLRGDASPSEHGVPLVLINPRIVGRSDEVRMLPWREICLVLPADVEVELLQVAK